MTCEKDFDIDLSGYTQSITQNFNGHRNWASLINIGPFRFMQNNKLHTLSYISEKVGRSGIFELEKNQNNIMSGIFRKPRSAKPRCEIITCHLCKKHCP